MKTVQHIAAEIGKELTEHPERWTQDCYARNQKGESCATDSPRAVCWCILGELSLRAPESYGLWESFARTSGFKDSNELAEWNDAPGRTVAEVIALCEQVAS